MRTWSGHLTEEWLKAWKAGTLSAEEQQMIFTHTGCCDHCAELLFDFLEQDLAEPPAYLQKEILEQSKSLRVQAGRNVYQTSRQMRLFLYSLKVGFAVAVSILVLFAVPVQEESWANRKPRLLEDARQIITERIQSGLDRLDRIGGWLIDIDDKEEQND